MTGVLTGGAFALVEERAIQGETVALHNHDHDRESFYVFDGESAFFLDEQHSNDRFLRPQPLFLEPPLERGRRGVGLSHLGQFRIEGSPLPLMQREITEFDQQGDPFVSSTFRGSPRKSP